MTKSQPIIPLFALGIALLFSGAAGLINQVIWQRSFKVLLGGGESLSSTIVVLVFMAGLGVGSWWCSKKIARVRNPLKLFLLIEVALALVNSVVTWALTKDLSASVFTLNSVASSFNLPLSVVYATGSFILLFIPCLLMGATIPLAAEVCQRNLALKSSVVIAWLLSINTMGSVAGCILSGSIMIPLLGLTKSLVIAAACNLLAGALLLFLQLTSPPPSTISTQDNSQAAPNNSPPKSSGELAMLLLGLCSLGYEIYLLRLFALSFQPLPQTFGAVITGFLLFWSIGAALASRTSGPSIYKSVFYCCTCMLAVGVLSLQEIIPSMHFSKDWKIYFATLVILAFTFSYIAQSFLPSSAKKQQRISELIILILGGVFVYHSLEHSTTRLDGYSPAALCSFVLNKSLYFLPCLFFGYLFGKIVTGISLSWGQDVGRLYMYNTVGACTGVLFLTFVAYHTPHFVILIFFVLALLSLLKVATSLDTFSAKAAKLNYWFIGLAALLIVSALTFNISKIIPGYSRYPGKEGVIKVSSNGNLNWDGLWHSALSLNNNHVGTMNWYLAVIPALCHADSNSDKSACVIGTGTGITATTLTKLDDISQVTSFDINKKLKQVFYDFPEGTLHFQSNKKVNMQWQDARAALTLNPTKYDIIQTQPLYLKQAGSSALNSKEFFELVKSRLKPNGVFCLYSNGTPEQAFVIRETADQVFPYRETFFSGYMVICSNAPISFTQASILKKLNRNNDFWKEVKSHAHTSTPDKVLSLMDSPRLLPGDQDLIITDNSPIVEYPDFLKKRVADKNYPFSLPKPRRKMSY